MKLAQRVAAALLSCATQSARAGGESGPPAVHNPSRIMRLVWDGHMRAYRVRLAYDRATSFFFPTANCIEYEVGNPELFGVLSSRDADSAPSNKITITPRLNRPGAESNVNVQCDGGLRVSFDLEIAEPAQAVNSVEMELADETTALIRTVVDTERSRAQTQCKQALTDAAEQQRDDAWREVLEGFATERRVMERPQRAKDQLVFLTVGQPLVLGKTALLAFRLENRDATDFTLERVQVVTGKAAVPVDNLRVFLRTDSVAVDRRVEGAVAFDAVLPPDKLGFQVIERHGRGRTIAVEGLRL